MDNHIQQSYLSPKSVHITLFVVEMTKENGTNTTLEAKWKLGDYSSSMTILPYMEVHL